MEYNTQREKLTLPEYGRNIQHMVDYCVSLPDKEQRKRCADSVIEIMGNMFPHLRDVNDFKHILWDHLAIMSNFKLDIDYPFEIIKKENLITKPNKIEYSRPTMRYRHYGKTLQRMIHHAAEMEEGEERTQLIDLLVMHMKKSYLQWNKEVDDAKIFEDLYELSEGKIKMDDAYIISNVKVNTSKQHLKSIKNQRKRR